MLPPPVFLLLVMLPTASDSISTGINPVNLALHQPTFQKDGAAHGGVASRAVDGSAESCTHTTENSHEPWWAVDLGKTMNITLVKISNSLEVPQRLADFQIGLTNNNPSVVAPSIGGYYVCAAQESAMLGGETKEYECIGTNRYVIVQLKGDNAFTLCEVEVYGDVLKTHSRYNDNPKNVDHHNTSGNGFLTPEMINGLLDKVGDKMTYSLVGGVLAAIVVVVIFALFVINVDRKKKDKVSDIANLGDSIEDEEPKDCIISISDASHKYAV